MKIIYFLALVLFLPVVVAVDPIIDDVIVSDTVQNSIITVQGQNFGSHSLDVEWTGGRIENDGLGFDVTNWQDWSTILPGNSVPLKFLTDDEVWSGDYSIDMGVDSDEDCGMAPCASRLSYSLGLWDKLYISYWLNLDSISTRNGEISSKHMWLTCEDCPNPTGNYRNIIKHTMSVNEGNPGQVGFFEGISDAYLNCQDTFYDAWSWDSWRFAEGVGYDFQDPIDQAAAYWTRGSRFDYQSKFGVNENEWVRVSYYYDRGTMNNYDGEAYGAFFRPDSQGTHEKGLHIGMWADNVSLKANTPGCSEYYDPTQMVLYLYLQHGGGEIQDKHTEFRIDDIYIQKGTRARVELGNTPNYKDVTKLEIQNPVSWEDGQLQFELNYGGSFEPGDTAYVYVINEDEWDVGNRDAYGNGEYDFQGVSDGYPIVLGDPPTEPTIFDVSDETPDNGQTITLDGLNFGTHTMDLASKGVGPNGFIEQTDIGTGVDDLVGGSDFNRGFSTGLGSEAAVIDNENFKTGSRSFTTKICKTCGGEYPSGVWQRPIQYGVESGPGFNEIFVSWWQYFDPVDGQYNSTQWKIWYIGYRSHHSSCRSASTIHRFNDAKVPRQHYTEYYGTQYSNTPGPNTYRDPICPEEWDGWPGKADHFRCGTESGQGSDISSISGEWVRFEVHAKLNDVGTDNGYMDYWITRPDGRKHVAEMYNVMWQDPTCTRSSEATGPWKTFGIHGYWAGGEDGPMIADQYVDDIYVQFGTSARVELGNKPVYEDNTELFVQYPISWHDKRITFETNFGSLQPGDTAYLFVINDSGTISNGFAITLGDGGSTPGPTCFDNIQNQGEEGVDCGGPCVQDCSLCVDGQTGNACTTSAGCSGIETCSNDVWSCVDSDPADNCPVVGDQLVLQNGVNGYSGQADACISVGQPDSTLPVDCSLNSDGKRPLYFFDLSGVFEGKSVASAELVLHEGNPSSGTTTSDTDVILYPLSESWNANSVTWNTFSTPGGVFDSSAGVFGHLPLGSGFETFDVTTIISGWASGVSNNGFILLDQSGGGTVTMSSGSDADVLIHPKLVITFADEGCIPTEFDVTGECGTVDFDDFIVVVQFFRTTDTRYDFNGDNQVNVLDLVLHLLNWS